MMFAALQASKIVVFVADGSNANAYYEAGCADALGKEVILVASSLSELKFDMRHRHTIAYNGNLKTLRQELVREIRAIRQPPIGGT
jgi:hypothetical protein